MSCFIEWKLDWVWLQAVDTFRKLGNKLLTIERLFCFVLFFLPPELNQAFLPRPPSLEQFTKAGLGVHLFCFLLM